MWSRSRRLGLETVSRRINVSSRQKMTTSRSRLFTSRVQDVIFDQIMQATLIKRAKSVVAIYGSVNPPCKLALCIIIIIIINGRENKFTSAIIITCRRILTSR